ncbi:MAG: 5'-3' exoribonuclease 2 [Caeruleum heppii]|nr:MAG: 5'-3' exoribonuclease 2 [Caeruleum heppii]
MGVPALFRWLSQKYPKIISPVIEDRPHEVDGQEVPVDTTALNPNGEEMDNLYLDMNGIVHPCSHPEDRSPPSTEEEMMLEVFKYTERVVNMVRPRKLLMIAVDGVAPRAKMNQQRSRRFRSAQEAKEKDDDQVEFLKMLKQKNAQNARVISDDVETKLTKKTWDSNAITPGTPFMDILAASLRYWTAYKLNTDPAWAKLKILISDATVPGEGEHKIMEFIRSQRSSPQHDPNTRHVIYGLDADLIMLGLATHEPHFRVLREDVFFQESKARTCRICGQQGHKAEECRGEAKVKQGEYDEQKNAHPLKPFIWLHVSVLREYLEVELNVPSQPFRFDLERALDDWVFMCFFVGNDFLPHLPSLDIRENGIDTLIAIWRDNIPVMGGYLTKDGHVDLDRAQIILEGLAKQEDAIFKRRRQTEERRDANAKRRKLEDQRNGNGRWSGGGNFGASPQDARRNIASGLAQPPPDLPLFAPSTMSRDVGKITHDMAVNKDALRQANEANKSAAAALKSRLLSGDSGPSDPDQAVSNGDAAHNGAEADDRGADNTTSNGAAPEGDATDAATDSSVTLGKRKAPTADDDEGGTPGRHTPNVPAKPVTADGEPPPDNVRLWEHGYADRYYEHKFGVDPKDIAFRHKVARAYVEGLAWVLLYYFQGCPSWTWYYPYHYAPFAADFVDLASTPIQFQRGTPFRPFEQLMGVLPAASRHAIPGPFQELMTEQDSEIIDFYPEDFPIDLNGKKFAWQGVALLPFIDEKRLLAAMSKKYPLLSAEDQARNEVGKDVLLMSDAHPLYDEVTATFYSKKQGAPTHTLDPVISAGLAGQIGKNEMHLPRSTLTSPLVSGGMPDLEDDRSISVHYDVPRSEHIHKSMLLRGVKFGPAALDHADIEATKNRARNTGRSYGGAPLRSDSGRGRGRGRGGGFNYAVPSPHSFGSGPPPPPPPGMGYGAPGGHGPPPPAYHGRPDNFARWGPPPPPPPGMGGYGGPPPPPPGTGYGYHGSSGPGQYSAPPPRGGYYDDRSGSNGNGPPGSYGRGGYGGGAPRGGPPPRWERDGWRR